MVVTFLSVLAIFLILTRTNLTRSPLAQIKAVIRQSEFAPYENYIINQMNLESGYLTNTLSQPPIYNPFSMGVPRIRRSTRIDEYINPNIDGGMPFSVYSDYASATEDFLIYLKYIRMPQGLTCQEYNQYIASKGYAVDPDYEKNLNTMC